MDHTIIVSLYDVNIITLIALLKYLASYSLYPVMHTGLCLSLLILLTDLASYSLYPVIHTGLCLSLLILLTDLVSYSLYPVMHTELCLSLLILLTYLASYSLYPVMHTGLCLSLLILYGKSTVICTPTMLKLTWPSTTPQENAFCSNISIIEIHFELKPLLGH